MLRHAGPPEQAPGEIRGGETGAAHVEQHEHAGFGPQHRQARSVGEPIRDEIDPASVAVVVNVIEWLYQPLASGPRSGDTVTDDGGVLPMLMVPETGSLTLPAWSDTL